MTSEEAIKIINCYDIGFYDLSGEKITADKLADAFDMAIEALSEETSTIQEKHQLSEETSTNTPTKSTNISTNTPIETLKLTFENDTEIKSCSKDSDLISRTEAIEAIELVDWYHQNSNKDMVSGANSDEHQAWYKADDVYKALEAVPSADRPRGEWRGMKRKDALWVMQMCRDRDARSEAEREAFDTAIEALKGESIFYADRPKGEWIPCSERMPENGHYYIWCSDMGNVQSDYYWNGFENGMKYGYHIIAWMPLPEPYKESDTK